MKKSRAFRVFTVTMSSRWQLTVPVSLRNAVGLGRGTRVEVLRLDDQRFSVQRQRPSRILEFAGDLGDLMKSRTGKQRKEGTR